MIYKKQQSCSAGSWFLLLCSSLGGSLFCFALFYPDPDADDDGCRENEQQYQRRQRSGKTNV